MSRHVADATGTGFLSSWRFVSGGISHYLPSSPSISTTIKSTNKTTLWRCILISPLEKATLLVSWLPTGVEHPALVWTILLDCARHRRFITVTHSLPCRSSCNPFMSPVFPKSVPEPQREPLRLGGQWCLQRRPSTLRCPLLTWLVCPQKEVAASRVALVELATLVGTIFAHGQEECVLTTITHNDITATAGQWRLWLRGPGRDRRKGRPRI